MAELHVSNKSIMKLLEENHFIIPEYQRKYAWDEEQCEVLWDDLMNFVKKNYSGENYFLGSVIFYQEEDDKKSIIDGQQRITSFLLLLRAFYAVLKDMEIKHKQETRISGMMRQIAPCIWHGKNSSELDNPNFDKQRLETRRIYENDKDKAVFKKIFSEHPPEPESINSNKNKNENQYLKNYILFFTKLSRLQNDGITSITEFCTTIRKCIIILPIECYDLEMSMTIFSTLNDRGVPLEDYDIFRSQLYQLARKEDKQKQFTDDWNIIEKLCNETKDLKIPTTIQNIFQYNMHIERARQNKTPTNVPAIRKFYLEKNKNRLTSNIIPILKDIALLWNHIGTNFSNEDISLSDTIKKYIQILYFYPNSEWRNILTIVYNEFFSANGSDTLEKQIKPLVAALYYHFLERKSVTYIRLLCQEIGINIKQGKNILHGISFDINKNIVEDGISNKTRKGLILLYTYCDEKQEFIDKITTFDIEHILPKKWQEANYQSLERNSEEAERLIDSIGNISFLEKKLNIQAGNEYFGKKQVMYRGSNIKELRSIAENKKEWGKTEIKEREKHIIDILYDFFTKHLPQKNK